jgi:hypothetical protein
MPPDGPVAPIGDAMSAVWWSSVSDRDASSGQTVPAHAGMDRNADRHSTTHEPAPVACRSGLVLYGQSLLIVALWTGLLGTLVAAIYYVAGVL